MAEKIENTIPEYLSPNNTDSFMNIATQLNIFDQERIIFEEFPKFVEKTQSPRIDFDEFSKFILNKGIQGLSLLINIKSYNIKLFQKLVKGKFCVIEEGTSENPKIITFQEPDTTIANVAASIKEDDTALLKNTIQDIYKNIAMYTKADIPFPTKQSLSNELKNKQLPEEKIHYLLKSIPALPFKEFTIEHIEDKLKDGPILEIDFNEEDHIILPTSNADQLFKTILTQKIRHYVEDNPNIQDRIQMILKKNNKKIPPIETVFTNIGTEEAFYWIVTFQRIMEYLYQHKSNKDIYLHYYEAATLLYQYSVHLRKIEEKKKNVELKKKQDEERIVKALVEEYHFPWDVEKIGTIRLNDNSTFGQTYTEEDILRMIQITNKSAIDHDELPPIIEIKTKENLYFIHKYRFPQFFLSNLQKEREELQTFFMKKWAQNTDTIPATDEEFDEEIKDAMSELFFNVIYRVIPKIFSFENPFIKLFPDPVYIKSHGLVKSDLADNEKHKIIYEAFLGAVFVKKHSLEIKPATKMFNLDIRKIKKMSKEFALKNIPFYQRGILGWFFKTFFGWLHNLQVKSAIKSAVLPLHSEEQFTALLETFKGKPDYPIAKKIINEEKRKMFKAKQKEAHEQKDQAKMTKQMKAKKYMEKMEKLKNYFLQGDSIEDRLASLSKQWNPKIGPAKTETENNVNSAVNAFLRKMHKFNFDQQWIELMAKRFTDKSAFSDLKNQAALLKYVEILILQYFIKHRPKV